MTHKKYILLTIFGLFLLQNCYYFQTQPKHEIKSTKPEQPAVEREFRGVWVATVANIDWPSKPGLEVEKQKAEAIAILDTAAVLNLNAIILQVRAQCDAFYKSELEPWSYYLSGEQGKAPEPFYDPLAFWVEEAHKRGLELHAWFNPYRAHHPAGGPVSVASVVKTIPELAKQLDGGYYWLDPAKKETQDHSIAVVMDVVQRYDIDAVHFDDYFYPYPSYNGNKDFPDEDTWQDYLNDGGKLNRSDWRREAVNTFMHRLYNEIKKVKPFVKLGVSPFGIYRPGNPASVQGMDQYEVLYADAKLWYQEGWLDYFAPQLYWPINRIAQSYPVLLAWWQRENIKPRNLWPGLYTSRMRDTTGADENINEIMVARGILHDAPGHIHFSMKAFMDSTMVLKNELLKGPYRRQALSPNYKWIDNTVPRKPEINVTSENDSIFVSWQAKNKQDVFKWVVYYKYGNYWQYRILPKQERSFKLVKVFSVQSESGEEITFKLSDIAISAVSRNNNESSKSFINIQE